MLSLFPTRHKERHRRARPNRRTSGRQACSLRFAGPGRRAPASAVRKSEAELGSALGSGAGSPAGPPQHGPRSRMGVSGAYKRSSVSTGAGGRRRPEVGVAGRTLFLLGIITAR
ncbi:hypothetical protein DPEC_G00235620 [Dallia pectoralis]|uniref:Uncharacterized protein n=1 Tax=Dallia pectoralis TaxID=75939 RepID=A0ACC2FY59_DALPE|nr:hypothetical protein DPEC_G00235620 [Dallia pectoralis]